MRLITPVLFIWMITIQSCHTAIKQPANENKLLVGSWKFIADQELDNVNHIKNEDKQVSGLLIYTAGGQMSVQLLWQGSRASMMNDTIMKQDGISFGLGLGNNTWAPGEARKIIDTYDAYFGDYAVDWKNNMVTHTITGNLRPEKAGTVYKRAFQLKGDTLFLRSADPEQKMKWQTAWVRNHE